MKVIVSCTTTKKRIPLLSYMLSSIEKQSIKPDKLYINLTYEHGLNSILKREVPQIINNNFFEINWTEDIGSYRKLLPIIDFIKEDDLIITADDDVLYGPNWIKQLILLAKKYPYHIICARARNMEKNIFGKWKNYTFWYLIEGEMEGLYILPTGCGGVVYRKNLLDTNFLFDQNFKIIAPTTDDLWFRMASLKKNIHVYVDPKIDKENFYINHNMGLEKININLDRNRYCQKVFDNTIGIIRDWLGIDASLNDRSWSKIIEYSS
jgi:hypothetical protein